MKIQTQIKAGGIGLNHNQTEVRTVEQPGTCLADAGADGGGAVVSSDAEAGGAATGTTQAEPQPDQGTPEGIRVNHNQTLVRTVEGIWPNHNQTLVRTVEGRSVNHNQTLVRKAS